MRFYKVKSKLLLKNIVNILIIIFSIIIICFTLNQLNLIDINLIEISIISIIFGLLYIIIFYIQFLKPINIVLHEIKALLTGKRYKNIYSKRVDEIGIIGHFFNDITKNLERITNDLMEHKRMAKELNIAHQIQQNLLPTKAPSIDELDIMATTKPAEEIGGDSFNFVENNNDLFLYLGDVTGHGLPAGLVMIMVDTLLATFIDNNMNGKEVLVNTNKYLYPKISSTIFMTMVMFRWEKQNKKLFYTGAGHEHILIFREKTKQCESFKAGGIALGMIADNSKIIKEKEIPFNQGDILIVYSDGITEGENPNGELYGIERLKYIIEKIGNKENSKKMFNKISQHFSSFLEGNIQDDDMSIMIVKYN